MEERTSTIPAVVLGRREHRGQPRLRVLHSPDPSHPATLTLPVGTTILGRKASDGNECLGFPQDSGMSSSHARLVVDENDSSVKIADWGSKNGTHVEHNVLRQKGEWQPLSDGSLLRLGNTILLLRYEPAKAEDARFPTLVGSSLAMKDLRVRIQKVAQEDGVFVLLTGETGTGKELVARAIHDAGSRQRGPFVAVNCCAIPESLAESELFGHAAKSFNDAVERAGCFRSAHRGTLFLDEIGDMPPSLQPKLFRALQERSVTPVGSDRAEPCDVRVVSATNQDLQRDIRQGAFRPELFSRLAQFQIDIPPLRQRREDVLALLRHFYPQIDGRLSPDLIHELLLYRWPQNIRQLYNVAVQLRIEGPSSELRAMLRATGDLAPADSAPKSIGEATDVLQPRPRAALPVPTKENLTALLQEHKGIVAHVAERWGCSRRQIQRWMETYSLNPDDFRE